VVLENKAKNWKELVNITGRLLKLDPAGNWQAYIFNAIGNFNVQNFEAAEKSAPEAGGSIPSTSSPPPGNCWAGCSRAAAILRVRRSNTAST